MRTSIAMRKELEKLAHEQLAELRKVNQRNLSSRDIDYQTMLWGLIHKLENF